MARSSLSLIEFESAFAFKQPKLRISELEYFFIASGAFIVGNQPNNDGPLSEFEIEIRVRKDYPRNEPQVIESSGKIPRVPDRHMYSNGMCCTCVWEEWLALTDDISLKAFVDGPLYNFFLGQVYFEENKRWPFGERSHGIDGVLESVSRVLGVRVNVQQAEKYLRILSAKKMKGHWLCPCGCDVIIRKCLRKSMSQLQNRIAPYDAYALLSKLIHVKRHEDSRNVRSVRGH